MRIKAQMREVYGSPVLPVVLSRSNSVYRYSMSGKALRDTLASRFMRGGARHVLVNDPRPAAGAAATAVATAYDRARTFQLEKLRLFFEVANSIPSPCSVQPCTLLGMQSRTASAAMVSTVPCKQLPASTRGRYVGIRRECPKGEWIPSHAREFIKIDGPYATVVSINGQGVSSADYVLGKCFDHTDHLPAPSGCKQKRETGGEGRRG